MSETIRPLRSRTDLNFRFTTLDGVCPASLGGDRADEAENVTVTGADIDQLLTILPSTDARYSNQFDSFPVCFAFVVLNVMSQSPILTFNGNEEFISLGPEITINFRGQSATFNMDATTQGGRYQICLNGTHAELIMDCNYNSRMSQVFPLASGTTTGIVGLLGEPLLTNISNVFSVS